MTEESYQAKSSTTDGPGSYTEDATGGGIRGFLRSYVARFTKSVSLGSLPLPKNSANLGRSISNLGQVVDINKAVSEAKIEDERAASKRKNASWIQTAKLSVPLLVKNSILGALQFTVYDLIVGETKRSSSMVSQNKDNAQLRAIPISFFGGFASGTLHGAGHLLWEQGAAYFSSKNKDETMRRKVISRWGTCMLHSLSHSTLFGTYSVLKYLSHPAPDESKNVLFSVVDEANVSGEEKAKVEMAHRLLSIAVSGYLAGCAEEIVNHKAGWLELVKRHRGGSVGPLSVRATLLAGFPSLVGFLALELS